MPARLARLVLDLVLGLVVVSATLAGRPASGDVPQDMNLQGRLVDDGGVALAGPVNLTVRIYDALTMGTLIYQEDHAATPLEDGVFELVIGSGASPVGTLDASTFADPDRFLELVVNGSSLQPRQPFRSVPYAFQVQVTNTCEKVTDTESVPNGDSFSLLAVCPPGTIPSGGGFELSGTPTGVWIWESSPREFLNTWTVRGVNQSGQSVDVTAWGRCCGTQ